MSEGKHPWQQVEHKLAELKIDKASQKLKESLRKSLIIFAKASAEWGDDSVSEARLDSVINLVNRLVGIAYQKYKEVWEIQGNSQSPEFVRTLYEFMIVPCIDTHLGTIRDALNKIPERTPPIAEEFRSLLELAELEAKLCKLEWKRNCEIEALELEHQNSATTDIKDTVPPNATGNTKLNDENAGDTALFTAQRKFDPNKLGGKETAISVSYKKDGQRDMLKLSRILGDKAHIRYARGNYRDPKLWFLKDRTGFTTHIYRLRKKAHDNGWEDAIPADYWKSYKL